MLALALFVGSCGGGAETEAEPVTETAAPPDDSGFPGPVVVATADAAPQWTQLGPGAAGGLNGVAVDPNDESVVYTSVNCGGARRTTDGGTSWQVICNGFDYAELGDLGDDVSNTVHHPLKSDVVFVGGQGNRIYKSEDGGLSWETKRETNGNMFAFGFDSHGRTAAEELRIYAGTGHQTQGGGDRHGKGSLFVSYDDGETWFEVKQDETARIDEQANIFSLQVDYDDPDVIRVATDSGLYRARRSSVDPSSGEHWTCERIDQGLLALTSDGEGGVNARRLVIHPGAPEYLFATVFSKAGQEEWRGGVFRARKDTLDWAAINAGLVVEYDETETDPSLVTNFVDLVFDPANPSVLYVGDDSRKTGGVYRTVNALAPDPMTVQWERITITGFESWDTGADQNIDLGWLEHDKGGRSGITGSYLAVSANDPEVMYFTSDPGGQIFKSADRGKSWDQIYTDPIAHGEQTDWRGRGIQGFGVRSFAFDPGEPDRMYVASGDRGVWISIDGGASFRQPAKNGLKDMNQIIPDSETPEMIYAVTGFKSEKKDVGGVFVSHDWGVSFEVIGGKEKNVNGLPGGDILSLEIDPASMPEARVLYVSHAQSGVFRGQLEPGGGESSQWQWAPVINGLEDNTKVRHVRFDPAGNLHAATESPGSVYRHDAATDSWSLVASDVADTLFVLAFRGGDTILVGASDGVYRIDAEDGSPERLLESQDVTDLVVVPDDAGTIVAVSRTSGIAISEDAGGSWQNATDQNGSRDIWEVAFNPHRPEEIYVGARCAGGWRWDRSP